MHSRRALPVQASYLYSRIEKYTCQDISRTQAEAVEGEVKTNKKGLAFTNDTTQSVCCLYKPY